jgi:hypothetical protein
VEVTELGHGSGSITLAVIADGNVDHAHQIKID